MGKERDVPNYVNMGLPVGTGKRYTEEDIRAFIARSPLHTARPLSLLIEVSAIVEQEASERYDKGSTRAAVSDVTYLLGIPDVATPEELYSQFRPVIRSGDAEYYMTDADVRELLWEREQIRDLDDQ